MSNNKLTARAESVRDDNFIKAIILLKTISDCMSVHVKVQHMLECLLMA